MIPFGKFGLEGLVTGSRLYPTRRAFLSRTRGMRRETYKQMGVRRHNHKSRFHIETRCCPPHDREQQKGHQEGGNHIDSNGALESAISLNELANGKARILDDDVQPFELGFRSATKVLHTLKACEVDLPYLDDTLLGRQCLDFRLSDPALFEVSTSQNHFLGAETTEVAGGFLSEPNICAGDDGCFARVVGFWFRQ